MPMARTMRLIIAVIIICALNITRNPVSTETDSKADVKRLRETLLKGYDKAKRPVKEDSDKIDLEMALLVNHLYKYDERTQILTIEGVLFLKWKDVNLKWNPSDYGGIDSLYLEDHKIWQPDINLINSASVGNEVDAGSNTVALVKNTGEVQWNPATTFATYCYSSLKNYPYDKHNCSMSFGSWTELEDTFQIHVLKDVKTDPSKVTSSTWEVLDVQQRTTTVELFENIKYSVLQVEVIMKRMASLNTFSHVFPAVFCILLNLAGFWLQPSETSRYLVGVLSFVLSSVLLLHLTVALPAGKEIPVIAQFFAKISCVTVSFLVLTVIVNGIAEMARTPPNSLVRIFRGGCGDILCLHIFANQEDTALRKAPNAKPEGGDSESGATEAEVTQQPSSEIREDWQLLASALDRIGFWVFSLVYVIVSAALMA